MNESSQAIVAVKREVQLSERQRQVQERQEQGIPVDEWCASLGISKGAYYHRLRKVREYMCQQMVMHTLTALSDQFRRGLFLFAKKYFSEMGVRFGLLSGNK